MTEILDTAHVDAFAAQLHGGVTRPTDPDYDEVRALYNAMIDKRPALIARCADVEDVVASVNFGREQGLEIAIRCGGHNGPGLGSVDNGLVIDLSGLKTITVDPDAKTAAVGGGCLFGDIDAATHEHGLATPGGIISTTGAGGLILGGGIGHLSRKCGLSIDNILGAQVVLADGSVVTANENENDDLYWALRGGGGNFGVVTQLTMRLHPVSTVVAGPMFWELERSADLLRWYREFILDAPEDLNGFFAFMSVPPAPLFPEELHLRKVAAIAWCWAGVYPPGQQWYWRADFVKEIPDEAIAAHAKFGAAMPTWQSTMHLYPIDGAAQRPGPTDTPWAFRNANWGSVMAGIDPDPANAEMISAWSRGYHEALHPYSAGGAYVNMMMEEGQDRVEASYGENYERLAKIKAKYDPTNLFHVNQNIRPAG